MTAPHPGMIGLPDGSTRPVREAPKPQKKDVEE